MRYNGRKLGENLCTRFPSNFTKIDNDAVSQPSDGFRTIPYENNPPTKHIQFSKPD